ncbi:MAG: hypothetical protein M3Q71_05640 [Chloroflexota bacterium]|nr:hypothetical protein [Chloroflexota bacterium]
MTINIGQKILNAIWSQHQVHPKWLRWKSPYLFRRTSATRGTHGMMTHRIALDGEPGYTWQQIDERKPKRT